MEPPQARRALGKATALCRHADSDVGIREGCIESSAVPAHGYIQLRRELRMPSRSGFPALAIDVINRRPAAQIGNVQPDLRHDPYLICFERWYGSAKNALSGGSFFAPPLALTISFSRFIEAMSAGSNEAM